jgi:hypothetical protein
MPCLHPSNALGFPWTGHNSNLAFCYGGKTSGIRRLLGRQVVDKSMLFYDGQAISSMKVYYRST